MPTGRWPISSNGRTKPAIPPVRVNRNADITADEMPALLDGAEIVDHRSHRAADRRSRGNCTGLKHVVFLGTGARSYMNPEELAELGIDGSSDQGLWRHRGGRMRHRADVGGGARHCRDGPRDARRQLAARRRHAAHRQDAGPDRLRRHRGGSGAHRARQRHARDRLEPDAEELSPASNSSRSIRCWRRATWSRCICC